MRIVTILRFDVLRGQCPKLQVPTGYGIELGITGEVDCRAPGQPSLQLVNPAIGHQFEMSMNACTVGFLPPEINFGPKAFMKGVENGFPSFSFQTIRLEVFQAHLVR